MKEESPATGISPPGPEGQMEERSHLVIDGSKRRHDAWLEESALVIAPEGLAPIRHPLRRIDRITTTGDVRWQAAALAAIARAGAPVAILESGGETAATLLPARRRRSSLSEQLERLRRRRDWPDRLEDWRRSEISLHARALRLPDPAGAAYAGWRGAIAILLQRMQPPALGRARAARLANHMKSFARLLAQRALADGDCPAQWRGKAPDPARDLVPIFGQIALWRLARQADTPAARKALQRALSVDIAGAASPPGRALASLGESAARRVARALQRDLHRFHRHLLSLNHDEHYRLPPGAGRR